MTSDDCKRLAKLAGELQDAALNGIEYVGRLNDAGRERSAKESVRRKFDALESALRAASVKAGEVVADWRDDPTQDERWNAGCDFAMTQLCKALGVDPGSVNWDAATETVDGDVQSVIWNILRARMGEDWDPDAVMAAITIPDGWQIVPKKAVREMTLHACDVLPSCDHIFGHAGKLLSAAWERMLEVAPSPPTAPTASVGASVQKAIEEAAHLASLHAHHALWRGLLPYGWDGATEQFGRNLANAIAKAIKAEVPKHFAAANQSDGGEQPNATTIAAIEELERGGGITSGSMYGDYTPVTVRASTATQAVEAVSVDEVAAVIHNHVWTEDSSNLSGVDDAARALLAKFKVMR